MKVTFKDTEKFVEFGKLRNGDTFIDQEYDEDTVLVRVEACIDVVLETDEDTDEYDGYAVDIQTGKVMGYYKNNKVTPIEAEVIVQR